MLLQDDKWSHWGFNSLRGLLKFSRGGKCRREKSGLLSLSDSDLFTVVGDVTDIRKGLVVSFSTPGASGGPQILFRQDVSFSMCVLRSVITWWRPWWLSGQESTCQCRRHAFNPWVGKSPCRRKWLLIPACLPEKFHEQRSLASYSPWGHKELDMSCS